MVTSDPAIAKRGVDRGIRTIGHAEAEVAEVERVWLLWAAGNRNPTALARAANIPRHRAVAMIEAGDFHQRYLAETERFRRLSQPYLEARMAGLVEKMANRIEKIVDFGSDKDAIAAMRLATEIMGTKGSGPQVVVHSQVLQLAAEGVRSVDDIRRLVRAGVNENVEMANTK